MPVLLLLGAMLLPLGGRRACAQDAFPRRSAGEEAGRGGEEDLPSPLGHFFEAINPARPHRRLCEALGLDDTDQSDKPRGPEIPLALFIETIRPLGALKYESQTNYFVGSFTGKAPTLQHLTSEYVFADWHAARFELVWDNGKLETLGAGYQRTLGVGRNWAHGVLAVPTYNVREHTAGGIAFYTFAWKPEAESPWTASLSAGADRAFFVSSSGRTTEAGGLGSMGMAGLLQGDRQSGPEKEGGSAQWRPLVSANFWYTFSKSWTVGIENDALMHHRVGEYLTIPFVIWQPTKHFFVQAGAGYYQLRGNDQATFMVRVNLINPSPRRPRERDECGQE